MRKYKMILTQDSMDDEKINVRYSEDRDGEIVIMEPCGEWLNIANSLVRELSNSEESELIAKIEVR